jgi:predicted metal-dependent hydrolase
MAETLLLDDLRFTVRRSARRRTIGVTVERDGSLLLTAPADCPTERIRAIAREKQFWVYRKLAQKRLLHRSAPAKEYVTGESFRYLGRSYRLQLVKEAEQESPLRLIHGRFRLRRDAAVCGDAHFRAWYTEHGRAWLRDRVKRIAPQVDMEPLRVEVRDLGYRWGSCGAGRVVNFHWRVVLLPPRIIEYVIAHELVHLQIPNHGKEFWQRLERVMPDFPARKEWLAEEGAAEM